MTPQFDFFWKIFLSVAGSLGIIAGFIATIKKLKENTKEAQAYMRKKEKREEALQKLADNIDKIDNMLCQTEEQGVLKLGMISLLRFRVNRMSEKISYQGYMTIEERIDLTDMFESYAALGGNGRTRIIYEDVMDKFDVIPEKSLIDKR